ncbi:DUF6412 domain-containing protein [Microbacterium sp. STN6]|uniref:DUF6412 domain-containing protein n=1 Tax=Microbacterium sp. STN6 TaxID=2995588 RepID=UPI002260B6EE|nr:DUF6412 domain-containing protein [Microbacterium sp. STN6]MCX7522165.1 DUF6412 domain-containing protein [Microbacterium sp. STN6]
MLLHLEMLLRLVSTAVDGALTLGLPGSILALASLVGAASLVAVAVVIAARSVAALAAALALAGPAPRAECAADIGQLLAQSDPDAAGRPRPRAPSAIPSAA